MRHFKSSEIIIRVSLFFILSVILIFTLQVLIVPVVNAIINPNEPLPESIQINLIRSINGLVGVGLVYVFLSFDRIKFSEVGFYWDKNNGIKWVILGLPLAIIGVVITLILESYFGIIEVGTLLDLFSLLITVVVTFMCIGIGEEIIFRGYIQIMMEKNGFSFKIATLTSAGMFGFLHFLLIAPSRSLEDMIALLLSAFFVGLVFSYALRAINYNLTLAISIHGFWDIIIFMWQIDFNYPTIEKALLEVLASVAGALVILLGIIILQKTGYLNSSDNESPIAKV